MLKSKFFLVFLFLLSVFFIYSYNIEKKYFGNIVGGGREKIILKDQSDKKNIVVLSRNITIELYEKYSKVNIIYKIKNNNKKGSSITFLYPYLISSITKSNEDLTDDSFLNNQDFYQKKSLLSLK